MRLFRPFLPTVLLLALPFLLPLRAEAFLYPQMFTREDPAKLMLQGDEALARNAPRQAVDHYTAAINTGDLSPRDTALAHELRGRAWLDLNRPRQALADLRRSIEIAPDRASAFIRRARIWLALDMPAPALEDVDAALLACPDCTEARTLRTDIVRRAAAKARTAEKME